MKMIADRQKGMDYGAGIGGPMVANTEKRHRDVKRKLLLLHVVRKKRD